jgi:hypothetical protein
MRWEWKRVSTIVIGIKVYIKFRVGPLFVWTENAEGLEYISLSVEVFIMVMLTYMGSRVEKTIENEKYDLEKQLSAFEKILKHYVAPTGLLIMNEEHIFFYNDKMKDFFDFTDEKSLMNTLSLLHVNKLR